MTTSTESRPAAGSPELLALPSGSVLHVDGVPGAPAVLFLHGVAGGAWSWRPQRAELAASYRLFTWEARGHGAAAHVADAGLGDYYADAREALAAAVAESNGPVVVAGHSMGGLLAMTLACELPGSVAGLFLIDPVFASEGSGHVPPSLGAFASFACAPLFRSVERDGPLSRALSRWMFARSFADRERMEAAWLDQRAQVPLEYPRMLREAFTGPTGFPVHDVGREIDAPVLLVEGSSAGGHGRFPALLDALRARLGDRFAHETVPGGHYLQLDRPREVNDLLSRFVQAKASW